MARHLQHEPAISLILLFSVRIIAYYMSCELSPFTLAAIG